MAHNYHLTQTGPEVQELLDKIKLATTDEPGLMSAEDKVALDSLVENAYVKPDTGIPKTDLSSGVQTSLNKADTALQEHQDISGKADKVSGATAGDFAGLDSNGNLTDSGSKASDFATAEQGAKADSAYQKPNDGIPVSDLADGVLPDVSGKEDVSNKVTSLSALSTDTQYPSAKLVYDQLATKQDVISDLAAIRSGASAGATAYQKPQNGIPASDLASGVIPDVSNFITKTVDDLANYYLKSETYTKDEVAALIGAIQQFHYEIYASRQEVVSPANNVLYLIGPTGSGTDKYEEYVYDSTKQEPWVKIGDTSIDLSGYVTTSALNTALADYTTTANLTTLLADKADKSEMSVTDGTGANADKTTITLKSGTSATVLKSHQDISGKENTSNRRTSWQTTPDDTHYPSEKLVKDSLDGKQATIDAQHKLDYSLISDTPIPMTDAEIDAAVNTAWV